MNKAWTYIIDVFIGILIMFVAVAIYYGLRTEAVMKSLYGGITEDFISDVKKSGVITLDDYEGYMERMGIGNSLFNISFEHSYKILEPEYRFKTLEEIIEDQNNSYEGSNDYHYREVITERPHVEDLINDGNLNTDTNESVLADAVDTPMDPNHVHDENCYSGHKHIGEPMFIHTHRHTYSCVEFVSVWYHDYTCLNCGSPNHRFLVSYYWDEATHSVKLGMQNPGTAECMLCGSRNISEPIERKSYNYSCGYSIDVDGDGYTDAVGIEQSYQYKREYPQDTSVKSTTVKGCYKYHNHAYFPHESNPGGRYYINSNLIEARNNGGLTSYCSVPQNFRITWFDDDNASRQYRLSYNVTSNSNILTLNSYYSTSNPSIPYPETMTYSEYVDLMTSEYNSERFFEKHFNRSNLNFDSINSITCSGEISNCSETIHNTWYTTCGLEEDDSPDCGYLVVSLTPTHTNQTVYTNDPLITTARAVYKDGSERTVVCTTHFSTASTGKDKTATLTYSYTIDGTEHSKTCSVTVTVIPRSNTCPNGHTYNMNPDGEDPGCPYCREWIDSLRVINPTTSPIVITIGTTLIQNNVTLLATYMDGHTEEVSSAYIDNLDSNYLGTKPVTIGYKGASVTVLVTTVCASMVCDICGYEYSLYPDGTNPGCPRCIQKIPVFTGNIMEYEYVNYTEEILDALYMNGQYVFNVDDVFGIGVSNKSSTISRKILKKIYPSLTERWFNIEKKEHVLSK